MKELWARMHRFGFRLEVHNIPMPPPRERDEWLMVSLESIGYTNPKDRAILNAMRQHQQVIYDSDVFAADGVTIDPKYLRIRRRQEKWSDWRFGKQQVNASHLRLWTAALHQLALNSRRHRSLGKFEHPGHKRWDWRYCPTEDAIFHIDYSSNQIHTYSSEGRGRQRYYALVTSTSIEEGSVGTQLCTVKEVEDGKVQLLSHTPMAPQAVLPDDFIEVLEKWGHTWIWKEMRITNASGIGMRLSSPDNFDWIRQAIAEGTLICVTDGSYIKQVCPHLCSAAVILECSQGRGRLVLSFPERSKNANAYRGELLGLLCIHLLLLSFNTTWPELRGKVHIYSDCLGALNKVKNLPPPTVFLPSASILTYSRPSWQTVATFLSTAISLTWRHIKTTTRGGTPWSGQPSLTAGAMQLQSSKSSPPPWNHLSPNNHFHWNLLPYTSKETN